MKTGLLFGIVACSKTRVRCVFCAVHIPKAAKCIEQHRNGAKHKESIALMNESGISFTNNVLHCKPCNCDLTDGISVPRHIEEDLHENWFFTIEAITDGQFIVLDDYLSSKSDYVFCKACGAKVYCSLKNVDDHIKRVSHQSNVVKKLIPLNSMFALSGNEQLWCKVCNEYIENDHESIYEHIYKREHKDWFMKIEDLIENQEMSIDNYLGNEQENNVYCNKCQMEVECNQQDIESHIFSPSHFNKIGYGIASRTS